METMRERLIWLRKEYLKLSRAKFGEPVGMSDSVIKNYEYGLTEITDAKIRLICKHYGVSEIWLRTGKGDPFAPLTRSQEIARIINQALTREPEEDRQKLIHAIQGMDDAHIVLLAQILDDLYGNK